MNTTDPTAHPLGSVIAYVTHPAAGAKLTIVPLPGARPEVEGQHLAALGRICASIVGAVWEGEQHTCAYCAAAYKTREEVAEHIRTCPAHPMRAVERERDAATARAAAAERELAAMRASPAAPAAPAPNVPAVRAAMDLIAAARKVRGEHGWDGGNDRPYTDDEWMVLDAACGAMERHALAFTAPPATLLPFDADKVARECEAEREHAGYNEHWMAIAAVLRALPVAKPVDATYLRAMVVAMDNEQSISPGSRCEPGSHAWCAAYLRENPAALSAPAAPAPTGTPTLKELADAMGAALPMRGSEPWLYTAARVALSLCAPAKRVSVAQLVWQFKDTMDGGETESKSALVAVLTRHAGETITADTAKEAR